MNINKQTSKGYSVVLKKMQSPPRKSCRDSMCFAILWFAIFTWGFRAAPAGGGGSSAAPPNPVPPHEPLLALCICNFVIEEVQPAEAAGDAGLPPSEPRPTARAEAPFRSAP